MKKINSIILGLVVLGSFISACKKDPTPATTAYHVRMTDAPGPYSAVYIDLQAVEITGTDGKAVMLNVKKGIYDLLRFSNGLDTLIATATLEITTVKQIRFILGPNNSIVLNGTTYPLSTPSAEQSGLKLQVNQVLQAGVLYTVLIDFDANKSIVDMGNGNYKLKPVLRTVETPISGAVSGSITPIGLLAVATATDNLGVTYSSNVNANGYFLIMGLPPGTYSVTITPSLPFNAVTQSNVVVTIGSTTNIGPIAF
jgi:hypothetical protein